MEWLIWLILVPVGLITGIVVLGSLLALMTPCPPPRLRNRLFYFWTKRYLRVVHRWRVEGAHHVPLTGGVLIVSNHTAGLDVVLISAASPRFVRWVMALDMRLPQLEWFWKFQRIIFVERENKPSPSKADPSKPDQGNTMGGIREVLAELKSGGVVGIFPEGGIPRPAERVLPFQPGVGLMIRKAKVPVIPVWVSGTPAVEPAWASLWHRSRSRVVFGEPIDYTGKKMSATEIANDLQSWLIKASGWPQSDEPNKPGEIQASEKSEPAPDADLLNTSAE